VSDRILNVRVSEDEMAKVDDLAVKIGSTRSEAVRYLIFRNLPTPIDLDEGIWLTRYRNDPLSVGVDFWADETTALRAANKDESLIAERHPVRRADARA
jgi:hypothetical protein